MDPARNNPLPASWAVVVDMAEEAPAPPAGAVAPRRARALAARRRARSLAMTRSCIRLIARLAVAACLFITGLAAAVLALFAMTLDDSRIPGPCTPTEAEAAYLRASSRLLLLSAGAQVLAAGVALLVPAAFVTFFAWALGLLTTYRASDLLLTVVACHGTVDGDLAWQYWMLVAVVHGALLVTFWIFRHASGDSD